MSLAVTKERIRSIDVLRGLIMIIMALDHTRDFFHSEAMIADPLNPATTTPILYFTRWITHFCAPLFVLLSGTSAYLAGRRKTKAEHSLFLIKRGLWLIFMELTLVTFGITFDPLFGIIVLQVIWAIGISMVILGLVVWLPLPVIFALGLIIFFGHNALDYYEATNPQPGLLYSLLHRANFIPFGKGQLLGIFYPFLAWTGIMMLGYCMGKWFEPSAAVSLRRRRLLFTGLGLIALFIILRALNGYGDPIPWKDPEQGGIRTLLAFLNVQKYPPSLMFSSIILGIGLLALLFLETVRNRFTEILKVYG
ncbi:MAG: heparan-alpha-glucosaminide N-acetyltransferase domain-containing protein, partial [Chitinophagaceae bacterium]